MRIILSILCWAWLVLPCDAMMLIAGRPPAAAPACLGGEDVGFEETGAPTNWVGVGSPNYEYSPALECTESMELSPAESARWDPSWASTARYWTFWVTFDAGIENTEGILNIQNSSGSGIASVSMRGTEVFFVQASFGTASSDTTETMTPGTATKLKVLVDTSGAASVITLWVWDGEAWGSPVTSTDGTNVDDIDRIQFVNGADTENLIVDYIKTSTSDIASPD